MAFDILIVDDEQDIRELVSGILSDEGYITRTASCCVEAMKSIKESQPHLIILDVWLGEAEIDGLRLLNMIKTDNEFIPIIMMSGHGTIETAVNSIKQGAYDFIEKPFDSNRLILSVKKAVEMSSLKRENEELKAKAKIDDAIIGISQKTNILRNEIKRISKLGKTCFIHGPVGSDKEGIAREIHRQSEVSELSFIVINCQIYNQNQLEIDLFGLEVNDN
ncbi:MAG: response regulator, partial [Holosporales bacterium]|nr:response regulator [Holosporales bacterium]